MKEGYLTNVYFKRELSHTGEWGNIKIGESIDTEKRGKQLETGNSSRLIEIACIPNVPPSVENDLHNRFDKERIWDDKEWFEPSKRLLKHIENIKHTQGSIDNRWSFVKSIPVFIVIVVIFFFVLKSCKSTEDIPPKQIVPPKQIKTTKQIVPPKQIKTTKQIVPPKQIVVLRPVQIKSEWEKIEADEEKFKKEQYQKSYRYHKRKFRTPTKITLVTLRCYGIEWRGYIRSVSNDYVDILSDGVVISLEKDGLSSLSKAICYREDYAKYMTTTNEHRF